MPDPSRHAAAPRVLSRLLLLAALPLLAWGCDTPPAAGGRCHLEQEGQVLGCEGPTAGLICHGIRIASAPCRGPKGCVAGERPTCDRTIGEEGEECATPDPYGGRAGEAVEIACSQDQKRALVCKQGKFALSRHCRGPKACGVGAGPVSCDQSVAEAGDACERSGGDLQACSVDRKALLACEDAPKGDGKVYVVKGGCPTPKGCETGLLSGSSFPIPVCDYRGQPEGSPCDEWSKNRSICNPDKTGIFRCDPASHTWLPEASCKPNERCRPYSGDETLINAVVVCGP